MGAIFKEIVSVLKKDIKGGGPNLLMGERFKAFRNKLGTAILIMNPHNEKDPAAISIKDLSILIDWLENFEKP